ncbi:MAG: complex I subunit 1 family protein [Myxococcota bacterium]|jgi:NADH-quinone oxidoreductase subunit H|nr:complex I subunit 1 family protein [Myxococcota bacterium]
MPEWLISIIKIAAIVFGFVMAVASLLTVLGDRKQSAKIQNRIGPNRARLFDKGFLQNTGIPHFIADGIKMVLKENTIPDGANKFLFLIAPMLVFLPGLFAWATIPFMDQWCTGQIQVITNHQEVCTGGEWKNYFQIMDINGGLLYAFAIASISVYGAAIAGWASNSKFSLIGGLRSSAQMISYEVTMGLSLAGIILLYGTLDFNEMSRLQGEQLFGFLPMWGVFLQPVAFFVFFLAGMAETKRSPFDLPEGESELVAGYITEYSSMRFGVMQLGEYAATVFIGALVAIMFFGGWQVPWLYGDGFHFGAPTGTPDIAVPYIAVVLLRIGAMITKILFFVWLQFMMRWTLPRFRYDQVMTLGWKILLPISLANLLVTALLAAIF